MVVEVKSALEVIANRRHFPDLELALEFAGCNLRPSKSAGVAVVPTDSGGGKADPSWSESIDPEGVSDSTIRDVDFVKTPRRRMYGSDVEDPLTRVDGRSGFIRAKMLPEEFEGPEPGPYRSVQRIDDSNIRASRTTSINAGAARAKTNFMESFLRRHTSTAEIDVGKVVEQVALARPIIELARVERPSISAPIVVLYDTTLAIGPFQDDVSRTVRSVANLLSCDELTFQAFRGSPLRGCGAGPVWTWNRFSPPRVVTTFVFISGNFGDDISKRAVELGHIAARLSRLGHTAHVLWFGDPPLKALRRRAQWLVVRA